MMQGDVAERQRALPHVLWLGGAPDAGKSSVVKKLGERYAFRWYNFDHFEPAHIERMRAKPHPATDAFLAMTMDERWVLRPVDVMAQTMIAAWRERFPLVIEDLLSWPQDRPIIAEGPGLFPECVAPLLSSSRQALWLIPAEGFKRAVFPTRENKIATAAQTSDPERARSNIIGRDLLMGAHIKERARELGLMTLVVDGARPIETLAAVVAAHFGSLLRSSDSPAD